MPGPSLQPGDPGDESTLLELQRRFGDRLSWPNDRIGCVDQFLSPDEVAFVASELRYAYWQPSPNYQQMPDGTRRDVVDDFRVGETAYSHWFTAKLGRFLGSMDQKISAAFGFPRECLEPWQATKYKPGGYFKFHRDSGYWDDHPSGERIRTFLLYLSAAEAGGATSFRALHLDVQPAPGRLVFWLNLGENGRADYRMIHASSPVEKGIKLTLTGWQRQRPWERPVRGESAEQAR